MADLKVNETDPTSQKPSCFTHEKFKWYAVVTQSGMEKKAKVRLEERIKNAKMLDHFGQIIIPTITVEKIDESGKKKKVEQKMMPGYLFIQMDPSHKGAFGFVKDTSKISSFIGVAANQDPRPLTDEEMSRIFNRAAEATKAAPAKPLTAFEKGEKVKVIDGPFTNFVGDIDEVKADKMKLRLLISVFGRPTPVELEFNKVEKLRDGE